MHRPERAVNAKDRQEEHEWVWAQHYPFRPDRARGYQRCEQINIRSIAQTLGYAPGQSNCHKMHCDRERPDSEIEGPTDAEPPYDRSDDIPQQRRMMLPEI